MASSPSELTPENPSVTPPLEPVLDSLELELSEGVEAAVLPREGVPTEALLEASKGVNDLIIVGSGPAGYTAAIYAARAQLNPLVFEGSVEAGGALMTTTEVENYPGFPAGVQGPELMDSLREQAERFGARLVQDDVVSFDLSSGVKTVTQADGSAHKADAVILAMGSGYRKLGLAREMEFSGRGVSWCATCDGFFFREKHVAVVGGGDSAVEEALFLTKFARRVTLIHRRSELRASKVLQERAFAHPRVDFLWDSTVVALEGGTNLEALTVEHLPTGNLSTLPLDGLFVAIGHDPRSALVREQVAVDAQGYVLTKPGTTETTARGVFSAGDLSDPRYRQAITAAGSGCQAALDAERWLTEERSFSHS